MKLKKIIMTLISAVCILGMCVACSSDSGTGTDSGNAGGSVNDTNKGNSTVTDDMDELNDDIKDTTNSMKDNASGQNNTSGGNNTSGENNTTSGASNSQTAN